MEETKPLEQDLSNTGDYQDPVFDSLIANSIFKHKKSDNESFNQVTIHLSGTDIKKLKIKAFKQAFGEALRYLFYVSYALIKGDVKRPDDMFDNASRLFETITPSLYSVIPSETRGIKTDLAFGIINVLFEVIKAIKDAKALAIANNVVQAFQGGYGRIDVELIKEITNTFAIRFQYQIERMTISLSTHGKLRLHEKDGIVQFANVIAKRIGSHIMKGADEYIDQSNIALVQGISNVVQALKVNIQKTVGEAQNIKARIRLPTLQRCIMATYKQIDDHDALIEYDNMTYGQYLTWPAGDILTQTGIRNIKNPNLVSERKDNFNSKLGYILATEEEAKDRVYDRFHPVQVSNDNDAQEEKKVSVLGVRL